VRDGVKAKTLWTHKEVGSNDTASREVKDLFDTQESPFSFPKPTTLIRRMIQLAACDKDSLILDFFGGSGTTADAVFRQNLDDGGNRRLILVQLPEPLDDTDKEQKVAVEYCDKLGKPRTLAELTKERLRRAGKKIREENPMFAGDLGFRVFKLASSNIRAWEPDRDDLPKTLEESVEHLKTDRTEADILFELLLKLGLDLTVPIEQKTIAGKTVHSIGAGTLLVCLAPQITREEVEPLALGIVEWHKALAPAGESTVVFRDSAFADDVAKTNLTAILQQHGLENVRSL
jgi:adenine-specific DNA-methyltransferase